MRIACSAPGQLEKLPLLALLLLLISPLAACSRVGVEPYDRQDTSEPETGHDLALRDRSDLPALDALADLRPAPDGCVPACDNKACGEQDGCGGRCPSGSCDGLDQVCVAGVCRVCDYWKVMLTTGIHDLAIDVDGTAFGVGAFSSPSGSPVFGVARLSACGSPVLEQQYPEGAANSGTGVAINGDELLVGGLVLPDPDSPHRGTLTALDKQTLARHWTTLLQGSAGQDELWDVIYAGGSLWLGGTRDFESQSPTIWLARSDLAGTTCEYSVSSSAGLGRFLSEGADAIFFAGMLRDGNGYVARYPLSSCATVGTTCPATCPAPWSATYRISDLTTSGMDTVLVGNSLYVVGSAASSSVAEAIVVRLDAQTGQKLATHEYNPTPLDDFYLSAATDGQDLYVVGTKGYDGVPAAATSVLRKLQLPDLTVIWERSSDSGAYWAVEVQGETLWVGGGDGTRGIIRRCRTDGTCS